MKEYVFECNASLDNKIDRINDVMLDHSFSYEHVSDGVKINGKIMINYNALCNENLQNCSLDLPIDLFISLNEIDSLKEITLDIDDFKYEISENLVNFKIITKLKGNKEDFVFFELSPNKNINDEAISLLMRNTNKKERKLNLSNEQLRKIEDMIKTSSVDLISTAFESIEDINDIVELDLTSNMEEEVENDKKEAIENKENEEVSLLRDENEEVIEVEEVQEFSSLVDENEVESITKTEEQPIEEISYDEENNTENKNITTEEESKDFLLDEKIEVEYNCQSELHKEEKEEKKEPLLKETYESKYLYYVIKSNETKEDILKKFHISEEKFDSLNKNIEIKKGNLVKIAK